ncbi:NAD-dependent epimerase/dehydratase family protein [Tepidamorphus sp. 3E244]|uniref:NAD-dependent epimerase/dehydratase family protein n=1 Tax=Tepidamorphus sp. 3E244 TaxID=3385498 RepID=UPI0038FC3AAE
MKNVIVTGGTGFVGSRLAEIIRRRFGPDVTVHALGSRDVDLASRDDTFAWFESRPWREDCDHIIHLAALYKAGDWPVTHPATQFFVNMSINVNVLEAWNRFMPQAKMTSILSYCMYPSHSDPHPESELYGTEPEDYLFAYALTKKAMMIGQRAYKVEHDANTTSVILPTIYGPGDSFAEDSHVMGALVGKFVRAAKCGTPQVEVWGDGNQEREFLYVDDAADGIIAAALHSSEPVLNLGTGKSDAIGDIAREIAKASGFEGKLVFNENRFVGVSKRMLDVTKVKDVLGWSAATPIAEGIARTCRWYAGTLD